MHSRDIQPIVERLRPRLSDADGQVFHVALQGIWSYWEFLKVIHARFVRADQAFYAAVRDMHSSFDRLSRDERLAAVEAQEGLEVAHHLEIESFYLFAKILLDKVARFIQFFFGPIRAKPLTSHDDLSKHFGLYVNRYGLVAPPGFADAVEHLKAQIADFRDHFIAHEQSPRTQRGTTWQNTEPGRLTLNRVYQRPSDPPEPVSGSVPELFRSLEEYLRLFLVLITDNFERTALQRRSMTPNDQAGDLTGA